eukprot:TRINITY_DN6089_c0_g1_i4.p2 TRINITY_DN6089_c0_g1~~TRINITY_DN6089_c0_g1_i4.p2  ORF type:complete len:176 (+),score=40.09 TRINITY_DN6089_c0_g1_i4:385-912(+)
MQSNAKQKRKMSYLGSEAMAIDVLEKTCTTAIEPRGKFMLLDGTGDAKKPDLAGAGKALRNYCQTLVEEWEEKIKETVMRGENFQPGHLGKRTKRVLCYRQAKVCTREELEASVHVVRTVPKPDRKREPPVTLREWVAYAEWYIAQNTGKVVLPLGVIGFVFYFAFLSGNLASNF